MRTCKTHKMAELMVKYIDDEKIYYCPYCSYIEKETSAMAPEKSESTDKKQ